MLQIKPVQDPIWHEAACKRANIPYLPELFTYEAYEGDVPVGTCQFSLAGGVGRLVDLANTEGVRDIEALFIMGRAALNFMDLCGVHRTLCESDRIPIQLQRALGYRPNADGVMEMNLEHFFEHPCAKSERTAAEEVELLEKELD